MVLNSVWEGGNQGKLLRAWGWEWRYYDWVEAASMTERIYDKYRLTKTIVSTLNFTLIANSNQHFQRTSVISRQQRNQAYYILFNSFALRNPQTLGTGRDTLSSLPASITHVHPRSPLGLQSRVNSRESLEIWPRSSLAALIF